MLIVNSLPDKFDPENLEIGSAKPVSTLYAFRSKPTTTLKTTPYSMGHRASARAFRFRSPKSSRWLTRPNQCKSQPSFLGIFRKTGFFGPFQRSATQWVVWLTAAFVCQFPSLNSAWGGLSATDVVVAVNAGSLNSRTLANHFVALRGIPAVNVIVLEGVPNSEVVSVEDFREKILRPLLAEMDRRNLRRHAQCIAYSADFPSAIDISSDLAGIENIHQIFTPVGSINSLTFLYAQVLAGDAGYISLSSNFYARREFETYFSNPGGSATKPSWDKIQTLMAADEHAAAGEELEKLLKEHPHQFPIAYLAASQAAQTGDQQRAIKLLREAVSQGWNASRYLKNDNRFDSLRNDPDFQVIELLLDTNIKELQPASGFDALRAWTPNGVSVAQPQFGLRYLLSTVLGVTRGAGTNLPEAIEALRRSAASDYTHPQGGFYFALTDDVRTTTRQWGFIGAVDDLKQMGFEAEILKDILPLGKKNILGLQFGTPSFNWSSSASEFSPGALADNLTSLGGVMTIGAGQTNLSELIKAGAAGSSGAVTEPYALQEKFPHPNMYVTYARGASLAEAFYLSVTGPYQLLIVGDPLCQPFSHAPQPKFSRKLRTIEVDQTVRLEFEQVGLAYDEWLDSTAPWAQRSKPLAAVAVRMLLDGVNPQVAAMQPVLNVSMKKVAPGYHEIAFQFLAEGPLAPRSSASIPVWIGSPSSIELSLTGTELASEYDQQVSLRKGIIMTKVNSAAGQRVSLWHDAEQLAVGSGSSSEFSLSIDSLGMGPARLQAKAELSDGTIIASRPILLNVLP